MRMKVYHAPNIGAAMTLVRDELGPDALILATRPVDDGIEITAAHEHPQAPAEPPRFDAHEHALRWHGVPTPLAEILAGRDLVSSIAQTFSFSALPCAPGDPPLMLVGPPGAGKTTAAARIATRLTLAGQTAHVITADGRRAGAAEQLAAFTRLLGLTLLAADTPAQLARAVARSQNGAPILIDMPGLNPADAADRDYLRQCQDATNSTIALVLPTGFDPAESADIATGFRDLGTTLLLASRLDQSRRLGGILAAANQGLALTEAGIGPGVADGLAAMTPAFLAERLADPPPTPPKPVAPHPPLGRNSGQPSRTAP